jgi:putative salt-induced outer membrane protein YdiY
MSLFRLLANLLVVGSLGLVALAHADQITLSNGDRLTGSVTRKSGNTLTLRTAYAGELHLRWSAVASVVTDHPVNVLLDDGTTIRLRLSAAAGAGTETPALVRIRYINPTPEESGVGYRTLGHANLALSRTRGNSTNDLYHAEAEWVLRAKIHRLTVGGEGNYGRDGGAATTLNWRGHARYDHFVKPKEFVYGRGSLEHDRFKDIRLRSIVGGGYGYQVFEDDNTSLSLRGGLDYVDVRHVEANREGYAALGWGVDFRHRMSRLPLELFHTQDGTYGLGSKRDTVVQTRTGLRLPIDDRLSATAQVNVDWESKPAPGRKKTDTTLLMGLGYAFQ